MWIHKYFATEFKFHKNSFHIKCYFISLKYELQAFSSVNSSIVFANRHLYFTSYLYISLRVAYTGIIHAIIICIQFIGPIHCPFMAVALGYINYYISMHIRTKDRPHKIHCFRPWHCCVKFHCSPVFSLAFPCCRYWKQPCTCLRHRKLARGGIHCESTDILSPRPKSHCGKSVWAIILQNNDEESQLLNYPAEFISAEFGEWNCSLREYTHLLI